MLAIFAVDFLNMLKANGLEQWFSTRGAWRDWKGAQIVFKKKTKNRQGIIWLLCVFYFFSSRMYMDEEKKKKKRSTLEVCNIRILKCLHDVLLKK